MEHDGYIGVDSARGRELGVTSDRFHPATYLWETHDAVYVSLIIARRRGEFRALAHRILALGKAVKVPTPMGDRMPGILRRAGYHRTYEYDEEIDVEAEVWVLRPAPAACAAP